MSSKRIAVIGGGAAGFFAAINIAEKNEGDKIYIYEKTGKLLQKVKISGGGRCNLTNACFSPKELIKNYPRGGKKLLPVFNRFQPRDTIEWFQKRGVKLKTEADNRVFPQSDQSQSVIDCFLSLAEHHRIQICLHHDVTGLIPPNEYSQSWEVEFRTQIKSKFDKVIIATGGIPSMWKILSKLGHNIVTPVPSLFTFHIEDSRIKDLQGISFPNVKCRITGTKIETEGPALITHWGLSGPAILKLSSFAARELSEKNYQFDLTSNFSPDENFDSVRDHLLKLKDTYKKQLLKNQTPFSLPVRYWKNLLVNVGFPEGFRWMDLSGKYLNKLTEEISNAVFHVNGKSTFKEEFVTCGGVDLNEIDFNNMESKLFSGLYFSGEVLDIDAITGGFNFQAAWTTAYVISKEIS